MGNTLTGYEIDAAMVLASLRGDNDVIGAPLGRRSGKPMIAVNVLTYECVGELRGQTSTFLEIVVCGGIALHGEPRKHAAAMAAIRHAASVTDLHVELRGGNGR